MRHIVVEHDAGTDAAIGADFHAGHQDGVDARPREIAEVRGVGADGRDFPSPQNFVHRLAVVKPQRPATVAAPMSTASPSTPKISQ
jgi:hypothetical protein